MPDSASGNRIRWLSLAISVAVLVWFYGFEIQHGSVRNQSAFGWIYSAWNGETDYEHGLWQRLQSLSDKDQWLGQRLDPRVAHDPEDPHFAMSFGGEAFFVVGLYPAASRPARRFRVPAMVFNLHDQFEQLRALGSYDPMRAAIIDRDVALAGSPNPMLAPHGNVSAARQYSGRVVGADWECPFAGRDSRDAA